MYVSLLFDVEDVIVPESDDIARQVAEILTEEGVSGTFCIVGERARQWRTRGRQDVIEALKKHDVGFHTDQHSVHPTIAECLGDKGWEDGVEEALRREEPGVRVIEEVFGVKPSCWGGPGNTWGPQINEAMRQLGVPATVYAHTRVPGGDVHRFCGIIAYPGGRYVGDGHYHETPAWERNMSRLLSELETDRASGRQWIEVFTGHPTRILHEEFWDGPNFLYGKNPPPGEWVYPRRKSDDALATALQNLRQTVRTLKSFPNIHLRTIREMNNLFAQAVEESLTEDELSQAWSQIEPNLIAMAGWVILPPDFDTTQIREATRQRLGTLRRLLLSK